MLARPGERWSGELPEAGEGVVRLDVAAGESLGQALARALPEIATDYFTIETGAARRLPNGTERQLERAQSEPGVVIVSGNGVLAGPDGRAISAVEPTASSADRMLRAVVREGESLAPGLLLLSRSAIDAVGGVDTALGDGAMTDLLLRLAESGRVRSVDGAPVAELDPDGDIAAGDESAVAALASRASLRLLVPELDWPVLDPSSAERQALARLEADVEALGPKPLLIDAIRSHPSYGKASPKPTRDRGKLLITAYGYNDSGGGTLLPRLLSKEFVRRGWDVTVFHAVTGHDPSAEPYTVRRWEEDGVRLVGVVNRAHDIWDMARPDRELSDPPITEAFQELVDELQPDVVHFHNLHNLGAELISVAASRGIRSYFTTHNYWALCPRAYFVHSNGHMCTGPGVDGQLCASCNGVDDAPGYARRQHQIRAQLESSCEAVLAISDAVRRTFTAQGYDPDAVDVIAQSSPSVDEIWAQVGRDRRPGRVSDEALTVGFIGSAMAHKGPQLLVEAAQRTTANVRVRIHGEIGPEMQARLQQADQRGVLDCRGPYTPAELPALLAEVDAAALPSTIWDCQNVAVLECMAARVPVLVPRMGGMPESVRDGVDGLVFDGGDVEQLAARLDRLATEAGLLERLQQGIEEPPTFAAHADELERYYLGERPPHGGQSAGRSQIVVNWVGDQFLSTSLARINRTVCEHLDRDARFAVGRTALDRPGVGHLPLPHVADVEVRHSWPPVHTVPVSGRLAIIQPWEFGAIPTQWLEPLRDLADEVWVPSEYVRQMFTGAGLSPDQVRVIANGVDVELFTPEGPEYELPGIEPGPVKFLYVGPLISRKGFDVLAGAWRRAFGAQDDVVLIVKDFGAGDVRGEADAAVLDALRADPAAARVVHITAELTDAELAGLYRSCDVLVHPYRAEGFAMPVLEAMASGLPVIVTGGGPTDEFCGEAACWRIDSERVAADPALAGGAELTGPGWQLEPDPEHLAALLTACAADPAGRAERGAAGRQQAQQYTWDAVSGHYAEAIQRLADKPRRVPTPTVAVEEQGALVLAAPPWHDQAALSRLVSAWAAGADSGTLVLLAPAGDPEQVQHATIAAAERAGVDLEHCADIALRCEEASPGRDAALLDRAVAVVRIGNGSPGLLRSANAAGVQLIDADADQLRQVLSEVQAPS